MKKQSICKVCDTLQICFACHNRSNWFKMMDVASQITHVVYASVVRKKFLADRQLDEAKFYVGNAFPDIRYLGDIGRKQTHPENPTTKKLVSIENSFELGTYCHVLIDEERERALKELGLYDLFPGNNLLPHVVKFIEDEVTYPRVKNWPKIVSYFDSIFDEEIKFVSRSSVIKWHKLVQEYFAQPPTEQTIARLITRLDIGDDVIKSALETIKKVKANKKAMRLIEITQEELFT